MSRVFHTTRRIEFCHTDAAGIAHFSALLQFMEQAEHDFWRSLGYSVLMERDAEGNPTLSWPRVRVESDFLGMAKFEDVLDIAVRIAKIGSKSLTFDFHLSDQGRDVAHGRVTSVCCTMDHGRIASTPIPEPVSKQLHEFLIPSDSNPVPPLKP